MSEVVRYEPPKRKILVKVRQHNEGMDQAQTVEIDGTDLPPLVYEYNGSAKVMGTPHKQWVRTKETYNLGQRTTKQGMPIEGQFFRGIREIWQPADNVETLKVTDVVSGTGNAKMLGAKELRHLRSLGPTMAVPVEGGAFMYPLTAQELNGQPVELLKTMRDFSASASREADREITDAAERLAKLKMEADIKLKAAEADAERELEQARQALAKKHAEALGIEEEELRTLRESLRGKKKGS